MLGKHFLGPEMNRPKEFEVFLELAEGTTDPRTRRLLINVGRTVRRHMYKWAIVEPKPGLYPRCLKPVLKSE